MSSMVKARRAHSMPSRYMLLPSEEMGEYDTDGPYRRRSAPSKSGVLFPLAEEGTYGAPPAPKPPAPVPDPYKGRERKPKVYSSYAVSTKCDVHKGKLAKAEKDHGITPAQRKFSRSSASPARRTVSASPSRDIPSQQQQPKQPMRKMTYPVQKPMMNQQQVERRKSAQETVQRKNSGGYSTSTSSQWTSSQNSTRYSSFKKNSSSSMMGGSLLDTSFEENEEYEYTAEENRRQNRERQQQKFGNVTNFNNSSNNSNTNKSSNKFSAFGNSRGASLDGMRAPEINSWDSMGILGLSSKMWSDTRKKQENFMTSTGQFLREDHYASSAYVM